MGSWRRLHNDELNNLYASRNITRIIKSRRMSCVCSTSEEMRIEYKILVRKSEKVDTT
jgi:hypothetical protein